MVNKQFVVVTYDISSDKRRNRLHKRLLDYGTPVQFSVFECLLLPKEIEKMKKAVSRIIKAREDHVRYYILCAACQAKIEVTGKREITKEEEVIVI